ncbi:winged helix-turn-helix domain-containing protein [Arsukibacterium sp. UBA3155]|uniref:winged helix-turn-helix domain-containing protein n=1 Tax=Arsukibacterium sp. UBA3155 TaxID=1946058 RepID=UPI0025C306C5|nr:winged helix-turn-helix domain-containing protein [Arsukibacterium sp. UBA3155]|tara:strand:+ start:97930 stop:100032 length:2103 start_codon:yes stop_codon:yes gene_type:complete
MSNLEPLVKIGNWYYQAAYGQLLPVAADSGTAVAVVLEPRLHSLLNYFLLHCDQVLDKDTLINDVWPAGEGTDAAVMRAVGALRKVLGDNVKSPLYISTIAKKGYQWRCLIEPLTTAQHKPALANSLTLSGASFATSAARPPANDASETGASGLPWRFISAVCSVLLLGGTVLAYLLASMTVTPLTKLPDSIKPLSALTGQEFWATLESAEQFAFYWYRESEDAPYQLARQDLASLKVSYNDTQYDEVSQPVWLDQAQLLFRALDDEQRCYFYQQQVMPEFSPASKVMPCQQVLEQGLAILKNQWFWLDYATDLRRYELWRRSEDGSTARVMAFPEKWQSADQLLVVGQSLYLAAQQDFYRSQLYRVDPQLQLLDAIDDFDQQIISSSRWDQYHALLTLKNSELQLYNLKDNTQLSLGPMTWQLTQPQRYQQRILTTQHLNYTTDIVNLVFEDGLLNSEQSWQTSNRNERLFAARDQQLAFVSERAGDNQVWLTNAGESRQLSRLVAGQYVQQLFWHQALLLAVIDNQLYQIALDDGALSLLAGTPVTGRYQSCHNTLYWTEQNSDGWQLLHQQQQPEVLLTGVVNFKCAPDGLVVQFYNDDKLALWSAQQPLQLTPLPVNLNWHHILPAQWATNRQQLLWLDRQHWQLKVYDWQSGETASYTWPASALPLEIHSDNAGSVFSVQPRHYDTDIVWLQNRS